MKVSIVPRALFGAAASGKRFGAQIKAAETAFKAASEDVVLVDSFLAVLTGHIVGDSKKETVLNRVSQQKMDVILAAIAAKIDDPSVFTRKISFADLQPHSCDIVSNLAFQKSRDLVKAPLGFDALMEANDAGKKRNGVHFLMKKGDLIDILHTVMNPVALRFSSYMQGDTRRLLQSYDALNELCEYSEWVRENPEEGLGAGQIVIAVSGGATVPAAVYS